MESTALLELGLRSAAAVQLALAAWSRDFAAAELLAANGFSFTPFVRVFALEKT